MTFRVGAGLKGRIPKGESTVLPDPCDPKCLTKVPKKLKQAVADDLQIPSSIASSKEEAMEFFMSLNRYWKKPPLR